MDAAAIRALLRRPWRHGEAADLRGLTVTDPLDLSGLALSGADFTGTVFAAPLAATGARFDGLSWFGGCRFEAEADFSGARFATDARFEGARFAAPSSFDGAEFRGIARFDRAEFLAPSDFSAITAFGNAAFGGLRGGPVRLCDAEFLGGFWAEDAGFAAGSDFAGTEVHGRLWLRRARLGNAPLPPAAFALVFGDAVTGA
jgi:uncharacterized protein YjbI with pentapeptide repeats